MAWKGVHICEPAGLSLHQCQLVVEQGEATTRIPVEDIAFVILDTQQTRLTGSLFTALMENGVILLQCDDRHLPCGLALPVSSYWRQGERESQLTIENRRELARIPFRNVAVAGDITSLLNSAEICVNSLVRAFRKSDASRLALPEFPQGFTA